MKNHSQQGPWTLRRVTQDDGRRIITLWHTPGWCEDPRLKTKRPVPGQPREYVEVVIQFAEEDLTGFQVPVRVQPAPEAAEPATKRAPEHAVEAAASPLEKEILAGCEACLVTNAEV
jgi:hypothetical protein